MDVARDNLQSSVGRDSSRAVTLPDIFRAPLEHQSESLATRMVIRGLLLVFHRRIIAIEGLEQVLPDRDPFILVANHNQRSEALLMPALLAHFRNGKLVHFIADWNFCLIPMVHFIFRCGQTIILTRKSARPRFLNVFRPWFAGDQPAFTQARQRLESGCSVGIYPEGTANRNREWLLKGFSGPAQLSLSTGVPLLPMGIRFPNHPLDKPLGEFAPLRIKIGKPLKPDCTIAKPGLEQVRNWHATMMNEIARLSGKKWDAGTKRK